MKNNLLLRSLLGLLLVAIINVASYAPALAAYATLYVCSTGNNTTGSSWANAYTTLATAITNSGTTGTYFYTCNTQAESATSQTETFKGAIATPDYVWSVDVTNTPPQSGDRVAGASLAATAGDVVINGNVYMYGFTLSAVPTSSGNLVDMATSAGNVVCDTCTIVAAGATGTNNFVFASAPSASSTGALTLINSTIQFDATSNTIFVGGPFHWINGSVVNAGTLPTIMFSQVSTNRNATVLVDGVDLTALSGKTIVGSQSGPYYYQFIDNKFPATVTLCGAPGSNGTIVDAITSENASTNSSAYMQSRCTSSGTMVASNTIYNTAFDGDNHISWGVTTTANASLNQPFETFEILKWVAAGTYTTNSIQITSATASLTNADVWASCQVMGTSGNPLSVKKTSGNSPLLPTGSSPTSLGAGTWATGGTGHNYILTIPTITTTLDGMVRCVVDVANDVSAPATPYTVNIDPAVTISP